MGVPIIRLFVGALLLFFGHRLFWLLAALAGFLFGVQIASSLGTQWSQWLQLTAGVVLGVITAFLAVISVRLAGALVGFLAGWIFAAEILSTLGFEAGIFNFILVLIGGIIGAGLVIAMFDLALVLLSSLAGAVTVMNSLESAIGINLGGALLLALGTVLAIAGIIYQLRSLERKH